MMAGKSFVFRFDDVEVRELEFSLTKAGKVLAVEPKAFRALLFLLRNPQKVISKEELLQAVWGDIAVADGSLTRCIWLVRSLLGDDIHNPRYIETVATVGYRFVGKVEVFEDAATAPEAMKEPNGLSGVEMSVGNQKRLWSWVLAGGVALAVCLAATIWFLRRPLAPPRITGYTQITHDGHKKTLVGTDGTRLYFNQMSGPFLPESIAQVGISGGGIAQVPVALQNPYLLDVSPDSSGEGIAGNGVSLPNPYLLDVSPDGSRFILGGPNSSAWNVRILGGSARRLPDTVCAAFSPDGDSVAYGTMRDVNVPTPEGDLWLVRSDGAAVHKLASIAGDVCYIAWSPDGAAIRFTMKDRIWEISSSGSGLHEVIPGWHDLSGVCCGRWTPDGKFFLILSEGQIWALDERHGLLRHPPAEPIQLTQGPIYWGPPPQARYYHWVFWAGPIPSKDGREIFALGSIPRGEASRWNSKTRQFQPFLGGISAQGVVYSKDGKSIAYVSYPDGILWKANRDGTNPVQLSDPPLAALLPRWSPDGRQILFWGNVLLSHSPGPNWVNYIVSSDGGSPRRFLPEGEDFDACTWSPDGHKIAGDSTSIDGKLSLRILDLDTRQGTEVPGSDGLFLPRWSPDGRYLAAANRDGDHLKIFDLKTQQWSELPQKGFVDSPEWSADGRFIYFRRTSGDRGLFRINIQGGAAEKIADLTDWRDAGWHGSYMGLDPADAPLLLRDIGSEDIYALTLDSK
jgi:DNA-binding winged helix-turn-helix (wHTH) protein/Tol biopolymer transport system component